MIGGQFGGQPIYNQPQYVTSDFAQPSFGQFGGQAIYNEAQYVISDVAQPSFAAFQPNYGAIQAKVEVPHPDEIKVEESNHLKQAQINLDKEKQAQLDGLQEEKERISGQVQRQLEEAIKGAEQRYEERLANLDRFAEEYARRLGSQTKELKTKYYQNQAQGRFDAAEAVIAEKERFVQQQFQQTYSPGMGGVVEQQQQQQRLSEMFTKIHTERQENMQQLQQDLTLIAQGVIPAALEAPAPEAAPAVLAEAPSAEEAPPAETPPAEEAADDTE